MHHFAYRDGVLHAEAVNLDTLADAVGTPFYCYSTATLDAALQVFAGAFADVHALVCYAMKANSNQAVIATLAKLGAGADVVSGGELKRARAAGIPADKIMFSGIGKTAPNSRSRSTKAFSASMSNPSPNSNCCRRSRHRRAAARIFRCASIPTSTPRPITRSPPARPRTSSAFRSAARARSMPMPPSCRASRSPASTCISAARSPSSIRSAMPSRCWPISCGMLRADGHTISHVDLGGGLGIPYRDDNEPPPHPEAYAEVVKRATRDLGCRLIFEPGRLIVGNAGILVTRVLFVKHGEAKNFVVVDAAMNDLIRPTLYDAHHEIWPVAQQPPIALAASAPTWWGRCAKAAISWRVDRDLAEPATRRIARRHVGGRLWRGAGRHLQYPAPGAGSAGQWRAMGAGAPAP